MSEETKDFRGCDIFGQPIIVNPLLRDKFIEPPFTILDTKNGKWQKRKRDWKNLGIKSEVGRHVQVIKNSFDPEKYGRKQTFCETSIFDPALCEVLYRWFVPGGGSILDPFAGGSVRGIVANFLGYKYTGIDIREEQISSNKVQAENILPKDNQPTWLVGDSNEILNLFTQEPKIDNKIKISVKSLKQKFNPCTVEYIKEHCHGRCCQGSSGLMVTIHDSEKDRIEKLGGIVENGFIKDVNNNGICMFKTGDICSIHEQKPFGCRVSPFTVNKNNTLIVRNRYRLLKCYNTDEAQPVYRVHRESLEAIFGKDKAGYIITRIEVGEDDFTVNVNPDILKMLVDNDNPKHAERITPRQFDFVFSCPPYGNLEVYSDLAGDISNMEYKTFLKAYNAIIAKSCALLKPGGYACFVVGEFRDKAGNYVGFVPDTVKAFQAAGMHFYNEAILLNVIGTACLRASNCMKNQKLVKIHQNILVFRKSK